MCGIAGFVGIREQGLLQRMTDSLRHRGPDGDGYFCADGVDCTLPSLGFPAF